MPTPVTAAVARTAGAPFKLETLTLREVEADEVRVRLVAVGVCHADVIARDQVYPVPLPAVLGHEGAGIVEQVGSGVHGLIVGDHVVLGFAHCGECRTCMAGYPGNCLYTDELNFGARRSDGTSSFTDAGGSDVADSFFGQSSFATHTNVKERFAVKVPEHLPLEVLAPLGCGVMTGVGTVMNVLRPPAGSSIVIFGAGGVGLAALLGAVLVGCSTIIVVDIVQSRLELAAELGATVCIDGGDDVVEAVRRATSGAGAEFAVDAVGRAGIFRTMLDSLATRGHGALVGAPNPGDEVRLDLNPSLAAGRRISFVLEGDAHPQLFVPKLAELVSLGKLPVDKLITRFAFDDINLAVTEALEGRAVKPVLVFE
jgi:aryl-alcohol dehydrogenase